MDAGRLCTVDGIYVFVGYLKDDQATRESFTEDGFFRTGDKALITSDGFIKIVGRLKELLKTSGGEYVAPAVVEETIRDEMPYVERCIVVGDERKFLSCLLVLKAVPDPGTGEFTQQPAPLLAEVLRLVGSTASTIREAAVCPKLEQYTYGCLLKANARAASQPSRVRRFFILPRDLSIAERELTPTMKIRRSAVVQNWKGYIDTMYEDGYQAQVVAWDTRRESSNP